MLSRSKKNNNCNYPISINMSVYPSLHPSTHNFMLNKWFWRIHVTLLVAYEGKITFDMDGAYMAKIERCLGNNSLIFLSVFCKFFFVYVCWGQGTDISMFSFHHHGASYSYLFTFLHIAKIPSFYCFLSYNLHQVFFYIIQEMTITLESVLAYLLCKYEFTDACICMHAL